MDYQYGLEKLIKKMSVGKKLLPEFRRLVDEGIITPSLLQKKGFGRVGTINAFKLIGYELTVEGKELIVASKGESEWF